MAVRKTDKTQLVAAACKLFRQHGYRKTSMSEIASACNINKASVYHHFPSKKDLAIAVMTQLHAQFKERFFSIAYDESIQVLKRVELLSRGIEEFFQDKINGCLMGNLTLEVGDTIPEFTQILKAYFTDWINATAHLLMHNHSKDKALEHAVTAISQLQGALMIGNLYQTQEPIKRVREFLLNLASKQAVAEPS